MKKNIKLLLILLILIIATACRKTPNTTEDTQNESNDATVKPSDLGNNKSATTDTASTNTIEQYKAEGIVFSEDNTKLITYPLSRENKEFVVPECVTVIVYQCFAENQNLQRVVLPEGIKVIEASAFQNSNIEEINIPDKPVEIGQFAFNGCKKLSTVNTSEEKIKMLLEESLCWGTFTDTPFAENYAKKAFIDSGKQAKLDSYSNIIPYDKSVKYQTNASANLINGSGLVDTEDYIYCIDFFSNISIIDKNSKESIATIKVTASKLFKYNDRIYFTAFSDNDEEKGLFYLDDSNNINTVFTGFVPNSFVILEDIVFYTDYGVDEASTDSNEKYMLYSYNMNTNETQIIHNQLYESRDTDNLTIYNNKIIYIAQNNERGEILMQYDIKENKSYTMQNSTEIENTNIWFASARLQAFGDKLYAKSENGIYQTSLEENYQWKQIMPKLDDEGYIYQLYVTDNYIFFFASYLSMNYEIHDYHLFRMKHDASEITNIYNSREMHTDGGSSGNFVNMYISNDKIFLNHHYKNLTTLDFDGKVVDYNIGE